MAPMASTPFQTHSGILLFGPMNLYKSTSAVSHLLSCFWPSYYENRLNAGTVEIEMVATDIVKWALTVPLSVETIVAGKTPTGAISAVARNLLIADSDDEKQ